jgi:glycosyltransferase involved in cell wall biosynthesis
MLKLQVMNLYFDARWTKLGRHDGISRYGANLVEALAKLTPVTMLIHDLRQLEMLPQGVPYLLVNDPLSLRELLLPRRLNALGADVVYSPMEIMATGGRHYKLIFTLHDLIYYRHTFPPTHLSPPIRAFWWLYHQAYWPTRLVLNRADLIVTVSETVKRQIIAARLTKHPVEVVYNAPPQLGPVPDTAFAPGTIKRDLVFMGTLMPYKNAELLISALPLLPDYFLHLTGRGTPDRLAALKALADKHQVTDRIKFWNGASDSEYAGVMATAAASVSASRDEGFGIPLLEGMTAGIPVVCTDMPIFHEVAADSALYFNPDSPEDFAAKITTLEDPATRAKYIKLGAAQAATFSWDNSAAKLLGIIKSLHQG